MATMLGYFPASALKVGWTGRWKNGTRTGDCCRRFFQPGSGLGRREEEHGFIRGWFASTGDFECKSMYPRVMELLADRTTS